MSIIRVVPECKSLIQIEEVTWDKVRDRVTAVKPSLAKIIDEFNPSKNHTLLLASYPYGVNIRDKGKLYIPSGKGTLATLDDEETNQNIKSLLDYSSSPLGLILDKAVEIYVETPDHRVVPLKIFTPGVTFGVWEIMEWPKISMRQGWDWSISSGARTIFMLPKISDTASYLKLKQTYKLRSYQPYSLSDQWKVFTEIAHLKSNETKWCTKILFFTGKWLEKKENNLGWVRLKEYWAKEAWRQMQYWSNKVVLDLDWSAFIAELTRKKIKLKPYFLDTLRHLISIGCGTIPAFRAADDSQLVAPTKTIQDSYIEDYGLKTYMPIIMQPDFLNLDSPIKSVYYSLQFPSLPEKPPEFQNFPSIMKMLRELKNIMDIFFEVASQWPKASSSSVLDFLDTVKIEYFHNEIDKYDVIKSTTEMINEDQDLKRYPQKYQDRKFPENSTFLRGCIRLSVEKK